MRGMKRSLFSIGTIFSILVAVSSCGDNPELFPGADHYEVEFASLADGEVVSRQDSGNGGAYVFFRINGDEENAAGLSLATDLYDASGELVVRQEKTAPSINTDTAIELPSQLAPGQYAVELTLTRKNAFLVKERRSFFLVKRPPLIEGILSFPLVITPSRPVLLIADVAETPDMKQYLRWTQGKKVVAKGLLSEGYDQILWEAPDNDGVYSVTLEVFPFPPAAGDFAFAASSRATAELFISERDQLEGTRAEKNALRPHYSLFDIYVSALRERESSTARGLKQPKPVIRDEAIGMKFDGRTGFVCPELVTPLRSRAPAPWTLSIGVSFEGDNTGRRLFRLASADKTVALECTIGKEGEPVLRLKTKTDEYLFPSGITKLAPGVRTLITLSVTPSPGRWRVVWKQDGVLASDTEKPVNVEAGNEKGQTVLGGENGVRCVIDRFDVSLQ